MTYGSIPSIGALRWQVTLATRQQTPDSTTGISETFINPLQVYADITPIGLQAWIGSEQIGSPVTHRCVIRYIDGLDMFDTVLRTLQRPDGSEKQELFRIRKIAEWQGRFRFLIMDIELELKEG
jgi:hypothetical protein